MTDIPLTLAVIGTVSPVVAGAVPIVIRWIQDSGHDKRDRAERLAAEQLRLAQEKRGECVKLLRLARDFRVLVENTHESRGPDLDAHAQEVRQSAADINGQADEVGFMVPAAETTASALAAEAHAHAGAVAAKRSMALGASLMPPDFERFDRRLDDFKAAAQEALSGQAALTTGSADSAMDRQRPRLVAAGGEARERSG